MESIKLVPRRHENENLSPVKTWGYENAKKVRAFHESFPEYEATPLIKLDGLASELGIKGLYVKDESYRFGLNAFKVLGGSYAIGNYIAKKLGKDISEVPYNVMMSDAVKEQIKDITFVTATDGNHGRGVAWTANRLDNILALGAQASITDLNYEDIPSWIMQGYTTMALEAAEQLGDVKPTHIFIQAGVGALAGGVTAFFADYYGDENRPKIVIVEPDKADCIYRTARANDGKIHFVTGDMDSEMADLCCGEPCTLGWEVLKDHADIFVSVPDEITELGMQKLGKPTGEDKRIVSGESGAVTTGVVVEACSNRDRTWLRAGLKLDENSVVLCFSTEGDTDRENYRRILQNAI